MDEFDEALSMLMKKKALVRDDDLLGRNDIIQKISTLISSKLNSKESLSLAITGAWGIGKSYVLEALEKEYQSQCFIFHYDCWKNDYHEEPLIAILSSISKKLNEIELKNYDKFQKRYYSVMKEIIFRLSQAVIKNYAGFDIGKMRKSFSQISNLFKEKGKIEIEGFNSLLNVFDAIEIVNTLLCEYMSYENKKIIFIVDELDRCLPDYAIKVLNRLHHICDNTPMIIIASMNDKELLKNINATFQRDTKDNFARHYLQRFFTNFFRLPIGNSEKIITACWNNYNEYYFSYKNALIFSSFSSMALSTFPIREQKQIIELLRTYHLQVLKGSNDKFPLEFACVELLEIIKTYLLIQHDWILTKEISADDAFVDLNFDDDGHPWPEYMSDPYSLTINSSQEFDKNHTEKITSFLVSSFNEANRDLSLDMIKAFFVEHVQFGSPVEMSDDEVTVGEIRNDSEYKKCTVFFKNFKESLVNYE